AFWPWLHRLRIEMEPSLLLMTSVALLAFVLTLNLNYICLALNHMWDYNLLRLGQPAIFACVLLGIFAIHRSVPIWILALVWLLSALVPAVYALSLARLKMGAAGFLW